MTLSSSLACVGLCASGFSLVPLAESEGLLNPGDTRVHQDPNDPQELVACDCTGECRDWVEANHPVWPATWQHPAP